MPRDDGAILAHLNNAGVDFVVIGGWAVIAHGYVRATRDVDVLVADSPAVRRHVTEALAALDATRLDGTILTAGLAMPDQGWQVNTGLGRVDVLLEGPPPLDLATARPGGHAGGSASSRSRAPAGRLRSPARPMRRAGPAGLRARRRPRAAAPARPAARPSPRAA